MFRLNKMELSVNKETNKSNNSKENLAEIKLISLRGRLFLIASLAAFSFALLEIVRNFGRLDSSSNYYLILDIFPIILVAIFVVCFSLAIGTVFIQSWEYESAENFPKGDDIKSLDN